jgi:hypothetical protein
MDKIKNARLYFVEYIFYVSSEAQPATESKKSYYVLQPPRVHEQIFKD